MTAFLRAPSIRFRDSQIEMSHGAGGKASRRLIEGLFVPLLSAGAGPLGDAAVVAWRDPAVAVTADSFVVSPLRFPGGSIGELAVNGTVNDLAVAGARAQALVVTYVLEAGLPTEVLEAEVRAMGDAARLAGVAVVGGDTKVVEHGKADQMYITTAGIGSKRFKVTFRGPGGHSFGSFGLVSPAYALGNAISKLSKMQVPQRPRTTFNVGVVGGGTSVNSIPFESWMDIDIRSETKDELNKAVETFTRLMHEAADEENRARSTAQGKIEVEVELIGDRPFGEVSQTAPIVQTASSVIRAFGMSPVYGMSSTDANIPMSMGIPSITLESGGTGGRNHTLDEWIDVEKTASVRGIQVAMGILLALAGM